MAHVNGSKPAELEDSTLGHSGFKRVFRLHIVNISDCKQGEELLEACTGGSKFTFGDVAFSLVSYDDLRENYPQFVEFFKDAETILEEQSKAVDYNDNLVYFNLA